MEPEHSAPPRLGRFQLVTAAVLGLASGGAGVAAVFHTENEVGSAALITVGVYFLLAANLGHYPRLKFGDNEIDPTARRLAREAIRSSSQAAAEATDAKEEATSAKEEAVEAKEGLGVAVRRSEIELTGDDHRLPGLDPQIRELAGRYNTLRYTMPSGNPRTAKLTDVVQEMIARFRELGSAEAGALLSSGDRGVRLAGAAAAYAEPRRELAPMLTRVAVTTDRPFNEFWTLQALRRLIEESPDALSEREIEQLRARLGVVPPGSDRAEQIHLILRLVSPRSSTPS